MEDGEIIQLLFARSEQALAELAQKYGPLCAALARNILGSEQDAEECVNDAWLAAWNAIPPANPAPLRAYLCRLTRNIAVARYHANRAAKRDSRYDAALDELERCLAGPFRTEEELEAKELAQSIGRFLDTLSRENRTLFVRRYWYAESVAELGRQTGAGSAAVSARLFRIRRKLKQYLRQEGMIG